MKILLTMWLSLMSAVCTAGQFSAVQGKFECPALSNSLDCARQLEAQLDAPVERNATGALRVTLDNGHARVLEAGGVTYVAIELLADRRLLVVFEQKAEGGRFGWLDLRSGAYRTLSGYPLFAPKGDLVAMAQQDVEAGHDPNVLEIHRYADGDLTLVHTVQTPDWGPADVRWSAANTLRFRKLTFECATGAVSPCAEFELERTSAQ